MHRTVNRVPLLLSSLFLLTASFGCHRGNEATNRPDETQRTSVQATNEPVTVSGCLRAGDGVDTFVVTASTTSGAPTPATYQLMGVTDTTLRDQIGKRVEVSGTVRARQQTEASTPPAPAAGEPTGTSGTPKVSTDTKLDLRQLDVSNVKPLGDRCEP